MSGRRPALRKPRRDRSGAGVALTGTAVLHAAVGFVLIAGPGNFQRAQPTIYTVRLVAAPAPQERRAPEVVQRPSQVQQPEPRPTVRRPPVEQPPPPPPPEPDVEREPAPRSTPDVELVPDEEPSTGDDPATVNTGGVAFPYPEYLRNVVIQIHRRWQQPPGNASLRAEILFFIRQDGSITALQFVRKSGSYAFDLEAQGAIEAAGNADAFGPLPDGFPADILPVSFFFDPSTINR